ncbi:MAG: Gfo/Idh/MocA family oxidoreductase [Candidatus Omnitrophota bacterium]
MKKYKALVVGCGNIGSVFGKPGTKSILSHAQAYVSHPNFTLGGVVDVDPLKSAAAAKKWKVPVFSSVNDAMRDLTYDVVSICVSTKEHAAVLRQVIEKSPKVILLEKPVTNDLKESQKLADQFKNWDDRILIHYTRRFMPEFRSLKEKISKGEFGAFISGHCYYSKGVLNNGSHAVDLVRFFLGEGHVISVSSGRVDFSKEDPTLTFAVGFKPSGVFNLLEADQKFGSIFEIELLFEKRLIRISEIKMSIEEFALKPSLLWKGKQEWARQKKTKINFGAAFGFVLDHVADLAEARAVSLCSLSEGVHSQRLCAQALKMYQEANHG